MSDSARFRRSRRDRLVAGVAGGLARDAGASPGVVRLGFVLLAFVYLVGPILYVALWIAMPADPEPQAPTALPEGEPFGERALRRTHGGIKLLRSALGVVAGLVGLAKVAIPLASDVVSLRHLVPRAAPIAAPALAPGPSQSALVPPVERPGDVPPTDKPTAAPQPVVYPADGGVAPIPALNVPAPPPIDPSERDAPALRAVVDLAGRVESHALASLDEGPLHAVFVGEALQAELDAVRQLREAGAIRTQRLLHRQIVRVASDGSAGVVEMVERWYSELRSTITGECVAFPDHTVPQTVHLARTADGWRVARIDFHDPTEATPQPCVG